MTATTSEREASSPLFELKGGSITLPIFKLWSDDMDAVESMLNAKVQQAPDFFRNAPVAIDLHAMAAAHVIPDFVRLVRIMRACGMVPVGVRGGDENQHLAAQDADLAILADSKIEQPRSPRPAQPSTATPVESIPGKLIEHPVRSGQRIYAPGGDLVVLAPVSAGAEIMADGNIHVYGVLRGRALAGVQGNLESRIFCMDLQAELIAIGGNYKVSEHLDDTVRGKPVQVYFRNNSLIIEDL